MFEIQTRSKGKWKRYYGVGCGVEREARREWAHVGERFKTPARLVKTDGTGRVVILATNAKATAPKRKQ